MREPRDDHNGQYGLALPVAPLVNVDPLPRHPGDPGPWVGRCRDGVLAEVTIEVSWDLPEAHAGGRIYRMTFRREDDSPARGGFYLWDDAAIRPLRGRDPIHPWPPAPLPWPDL